MKVHPEINGDCSRLANTPWNSAQYSPFAELFDDGMNFIITKTSNIGTDVALNRYYEIH